MSIEGWIALGTSGAAIIALAYAVYQGWSARQDAKNWANQLIAAGKAQVESDRNLLAVEQQRDTEKTARTKAEAELADVTAQLKATQARLVEAEKESTDATAESVRNAPDPLRALGDVLSSSARSNVPDAANAGASGGGQKPADV